jgi:hypothetical protein
MFFRSRPLREEAQYLVVPTDARSEGFCAFGRRG